MDNNKTKAVQGVELKLDHIDELSASRILFGLNFNKTDMLPQISVNSCRTTYYDTEKNNLSLHRHFCFELHICLEGTIKFVVNDVEYKLEKNTFLLVPPLTNHKMTFGTKDHKRFGCYFSLNNEKNLKKVVSCCEINVFPIPEYVKYQVDYILAKAIERRPGKEANIKNQLMCILNDVLALILYGNEKLSENEADISVLTQRVKQYIRDNVCNFITPEDTAGYAGYSLRHLNRILKQTENKTVAIIINEIKMEKAKEFFEHSEIQVSEAADMLGFESVNSLINNFKKKYGITPLQYRKNHKMS